MSQLVELRSTLRGTYSWNGKHYAHVKETHEYLRLEDRPEDVLFRKFWTGTIRGCPTPHNLRRSKEVYQMESPSRGDCVDVLERWLELCDPPTTRKSGLPALMRVSESEVL